MLKRFQEICGVGCFSSCRAPQIQFERMSLIYGENCYGKSTLCDILRSLAENAPDHITDRLSVPLPRERGQQVQISFALPNQDQETVLTFRRGAWDPPFPDSLRIEVFDTDFIHRNLFTGLSIARQNHENMTRFVLGDSGVRLAQRIATLNSELRAASRSLREMEASVFNDIPNLPNFLCLAVQQDMPTIEAAIADALSSLESDRRLHGNLDSARSRPEPTLCSCPESFDVLASHVETSLSATFEQVHRDAECKLLEHLHSHTSDPGDGRNWIRQGTTLIRTDRCPFCGQEFQGDAAGLIAAYQAIFNDAFGRYARDTLSVLETEKREFALAGCADLPLLVEQNYSVLHQYPELRNVVDLRGSFERMDQLSAEVARQLEGWRVTHERLSESLTATVQRKKENVHAAAPAWGAADVLHEYDALRRAVDAYNGVIQVVSAGIAQFKSTLDPAHVVQRIQDHERVIQRLRLDRRRIELNVACQEYTSVRDRKDRMQGEVARLQDELELEQTVFLTRYFVAINRIFSTLGSRRFAITAEQSRRGNMPTVHLLVSYNGVPITQNRLRAFFSESDRRALALSVFWARLETRDEPDLLRTIVVLDDPVTSFDDGRIDRTIRLIETRLPQLRQLIIMSHYPNYLRVFFQRLNGRQETMLVARLYQDDVGSHVERAAPIDFVETDHQRAYRRIAEFCERRHNEEVLGDLRVFLETEVRSRHHRAITMNRFGGLQLAALLDELVGLGVMSTDTRGAIEPLRLTLNADHHVWTARSHEEKIGIAEDVINCVYERL
jgi:wobble nucleotide-excising tRNase